MCEVNVTKTNRKPRFGDVKIGDMFQDSNNYWYMKCKSKDGRIFAIGLEDGTLFDGFCEDDNIQTFFTPSEINIK